MFKRLLFRMKIKVTTFFLIAISQLFAQTSSTDPRRTPVVEVFEKCHRSVVNISATQKVTVRRSPFDLFFSDIHDLDDLFGPRMRESNSLGSGFIIHSSGYIVTNAHVVGRSADAKVIFDDQTSFEAMTVAIDYEHDLALLKISNTPSPLQTIKLGNSADLMIGETVVAIGNPLGFQHTLTTGVISATNRRLELRNSQTGEPTVYDNLIQTDASINPGNSGGPLLNVLGELIGINTAIRGDAQNIGFAIPVSTFKQVLPAMLANELKNRFSLGLTINENSQVTEVWDDSPADNAEIKVGDTIVQINQTPIQSTYDYHFEMIQHSPGDRLLIKIKRQNQEISARLVLQEKARPDGRRLAYEKLGIKLEPIPQELASRYRLRTDTGLLIHEIERDSPADKIGMVAGDILTVLGRYYVSDLSEIGQILENTQTGDRMHVEILRVEGSIIYRDGASLVIR